MGMNASKSNGQATFCPGGPLEINEAESLRQAFSDHLAMGSELVVDLKAVAACDTAGAQLLLSTVKSAGLAHKTIRFQNVPAVVTGTWQRLGLPANFFTNLSTP